MCRLNLIHYFFCVFGRSKELRSVARFMTGLRSATNRTTNRFVLIIMICICLDVMYMPQACQFHQVATSLFKSVLLQRDLQICYNFQLPYLLPASMWITRFHN